MGFLDNLFGGNAFGNIFSAVLGGISSSSQRRSAERATREATEAAGKEDRQTIGYQKGLDYFYEQKRRHEMAKNFGVYNQFSTVRQFKPNYVAGPGLDAMPSMPVTGDEEDDD
jgi:hypothetical protein